MGDILVSAQEIHTISQTSYLPEILSLDTDHVVFSMEIHLSINKVAVTVRFTFISKFFKPYFGINFSHHLSVSRSETDNLSQNKLLENHTVQSGTYL